MAIFVAAIVIGFRPVSANSPIVPASGLRENVGGVCSRGPLPAAGSAAVSLHHLVVQSSPVITAYATARDVHVVALATVAH